MIVSITSKGYQKDIMTQKESPEAASSQSLRGLTIHSNSLQEKNNPVKNPTIIPLRPVFIVSSKDDAGMQTPMIVANIIAIGSV